MAPKTDAVPRSKPRSAEPIDNPLVHTDDGPHSESADGKSGVHPGWWAAAFAVSGLAWVAIMFKLRVL